MTTCLLSFSGGLDSLASAIMLKEQGYDVTLGHIVWIIGGTNFGEEQSRAAVRLAGELDLPFEVLARMWFPETSYAKYSWLPVCISTIMHHAGDACVYPAPSVRRYDSVAFGFDAIDFDGRDFTVTRQWLEGMAGYAYQGPVLFPTNGMRRHKGDYDMVPKHLQDMTVCCFLGPSAEEPCGVCSKCTGA